MSGEPTCPVLGLRVARLPASYVVEPEGVVDYVTAPALRAVLLNLLDHGRAVVLDLAGVALLDARSSRMLLTVHRYGEPRGGLTVRGATGSVASVLEITGAAKPLRLDDVVDVDETTAPPAAGDDWTVDALLRARASLAPSKTATRDRLRDLAVRHAYGLAVAMARRYRGRSEPLEDLTQVALLGLLKAVDGYDPGYGNGFAAYAVPTITGELKRYFRDSGWQIRVPRRLQEIGLALPAAGERLAHELGRWPTVPELAGRVGVTVVELRQAAEATQAYRVTSLSTPVSQAPLGPSELGDCLGDTDPGFDAVDYHESLRRLLPTLPARQRQILAMRYYLDMTQSQIAARVGVSQMHVSRLLSNALTRLRAGLVSG
jgi:RNA polymerase sigma-B factor